jgi:hypothetical protein
LRVTVCMSQLVRALRLLQSVVFLVEILHSWISDFNPYDHIRCSPHMLYKMIWYPEGKKEKKEKF